MTNEKTVIAPAFAHATCLAAFFAGHLQVDSSAQCKMNSLSMPVLLLKPPT